jgi:hypothetical protein
MKMPEDEQKACEHYKDDLHYQASMFASSFGDGYYEGKAEGINETTRNITLNLAKKGVAIEIMDKKVTGLQEAEIKQLTNKQRVINDFSIRYLHSFLQI